MRTLPAPSAEPKPVLMQLHEDLWVVDRPLRFLGLEVGTRMTVVRFGRDLLLHSPVAPDDALRHELADLGRVRWVVGPNRLHHLYLGPWIGLGAEAWGVSGLHRKRRDLAFAGVVGPEGPWPDALRAYPLTSIPFTDEAVFLHRPSRTLVVSDLLFNLSPDAPWLTRAAIWAVGGYPGPFASTHDHPHPRACCTALEWTMMSRPAARGDLARILAWDFDRIVLAHGEVIEGGGRDALARAYDWLGPS